MSILRKLFGGIDLTWKKLILFAVVAGVYTGVMAMLPATKDTSFRDIAIMFECWILFGILIIVNSWSPKDSALKCFVFFLISQPLVYLVQVPFAGMGWDLFKFLPYWGVWTVLTLPMGFIGYYMKKDQWWGSLILAPMLVFLAFLAGGYLRSAIYWFPRHLLSLLVCLFTMFASSLFIFRNRKARLICLILSIALTVGSVIYAVLEPARYNTTVMVSEGSLGVKFDDTYRARLEDPSHGEVHITYNGGIESYMLNAEFTKAGHTVLYLEAPDGTVRAFALDIGTSSCDVAEIQ